MKSIAYALLITLSFLLVLACGSAEETTSETATTPPTEETAVAEAIDEVPTEIPAASSLIEIEMNDAIAAKLAAADLVDGTEDQTVHKCSGCALNMDGDADHALKVGDYDMHFCSDFCKTNFADNTAEKITNLAIPEEAP